MLSKVADPGCLSWIRFHFLDHGSAYKNVSVLTRKTLFLISPKYDLFIPGPGVKKAPDPQYCQDILICPGLYLDPARDLTRIRGSLLSVAKQLNENLFKIFLFIIRVKIYTIAKKSFTQSKDLDLTFVKLIR